MHSNMSRSKVNDSQKYMPLPQRGNKNGFLYHDSDSDSDEDDFIQSQIKSQQLQMKKQNQGLEMLSHSAQRLGTLSINITEELDSQNRLLDDMENDIEKATTSLGLITSKTKELIKKSGGKKYFLIIVSLTLVVIVLIMLILYT